jgi:hypothetical protein
VVTVRLICDVVTPKSLEIAGSAGKYIWAVMGENMAVADAARTMNSFSHFVKLE